MAAEGNELTPRGLHEPVEDVKTIEVNGEVIFLVPPISACKGCAGLTNDHVCVAIPCARKAGTTTQVCIGVRDIAAYRVDAVTRKLTGEKP